MSRQPRSQAAPAPPPTSRQNEYFVPRDGIDREVISADICRYLGNDALVRPGHYENSQTGQTVPGYYITAYRNLTTAMIEDLKADSARWDAERRAQTSHNPTGGGFGSRDGSGGPPRLPPDSPAVQYRLSETHQSRQHHGPTESPFQDPYAREPTYDGIRYPGTGTPGYTGAAGSYQQHQHQQEQHQQQSNFGPSSGGGYGYQQPTTQSPQPDLRYASSYSQGPSSGSERGYTPNQDGQSPYVHTGANMPRGYGANDSYPGNRMPVSSGAPQQPVYASAAPPQQGYPATSSPYQYSGQMPPTAGGQSFQSMHPPDAPYGRASQPPQGYAPQGQQYGDGPNPRSSVPPSSAVPTPSGATKRRSDLDDDRHTPTDRNPRQPRR